MATKRSLTSYLTIIFMVIVIIQAIPFTIKFIKSYYDDILQLKTKVGLIKIDQPVMEAGSYSKSIKKFFHDKEIKAILLHIECPGGAAGSSQSIFNEIMSYKKDYPKPVVVMTNDLCASGGYYIACAADYIIASPSAIVGSIGSYIGTLKLKDFAEHWKVKYQIKQSGKYKTALNPFGESSPEIEKFVQEVTDDVYNQFTNDVAARRKLILKDADKWANGKFFTGKQALALGLVDELGSEYNTIKKIKELALIEKDKEIEWVHAKQPSLYNKILGKEDDNGSLSITSLLVSKIMHFPFMAFTQID